MMARFSVGDSVAVASIFPPTPPTHIRTPHYIRGCSGVIERICGEFGNPEELAFGRRYGPKPTLYRVRFNQGDVWPDYEGSVDDHIEVEIYEFWLQPTDQENAA
jgi:nitrile hydratase subunit beta